MKNVLEVIVAREYESLVPTIDGFCGCEVCREDVLVFTLNRLPPRYVADPTGEVLTDVAMQADQSRADVQRVLLEGFRRVKATPRKKHQHRS